MSIVKKTKASLVQALILSALFVVQTAFAAPNNEQLDTRLSALEMRLESNFARIGKLERSSSSDLMLEIVRRLDTLERDNANLRGLLEESQNQNEKQTERLREMGLEYDRRFESLSSSGETETAPQSATSSSSADPVAERKLYESAFNKLRAGENAQAISVFATYLKQYPQGRFADNAQYWLSEAYYVDGDLKNAKRAFNNLLTKFPRSSKVPDTMLKLAYIAIDSGDTATAKKSLAQIEHKYPSSNAAKLAKKRLLALGS